MCSILVVDDEPAVREVLAQMAERLGHQVRQAASADQALERMAEDAAGVAVCDVALPGHDGVWLAGQLRTAYPDTAVIMATGLGDADMALSTLRLGAVDFLAKPFGRDRFRDALARGVRWHYQAVHARQRLDTLQGELLDRLSQLEALFTATPVSSDADLELFIGTFITDRAAVAHALYVKSLATNMALSMGIRSPELSDIQRAALLHDVGCVATPRTIVCKPTPLSDEEIAIVRQQPRLVSDILARNEFLAPAADLVGAIFEHVDGTGYPLALRGDEIPRGARVIAVADAFDTMIHNRVYRKARTPAEAIFEIERCRGTHFASDAVDALLQVVHLHWASVARRAAFDAWPADAVTEPLADEHDLCLHGDEDPTAKGAWPGRAPGGPGVDEPAASAREGDTVPG